LLLALVLGDRLEEKFRLSLVMSGGDYATFADKSSLIVIGAVIGILIIVQGLAWALGYRKSMVDEIKRV
jgi:TctA family transporter